MTKFKKKTLIFLILFVLSLFIFVFVGTKFNKEKWKDVLVLKLDAIKDFKLWLDVSGWTKLVYKIDYSTYNELYKTNLQELMKIKNKIEEIILQKIDKRISKLWVSDYHAYTQKVNDDTYIVVEIWWISDLDQAKSIIWKTVELEFKLPNKQKPSDEQLAQRKKLIKDILENVKQNSWYMKKFTENKWSEWIEYHYLSWVSFLQLPDMYKNNLDKLNSMKNWELSNIMEWLYLTYPKKDLSWNVEDVKIKWFSFLRMLDKKELFSKNFNQDDIRRAISVYKLKYSYDMVKNIDFTWNYIYKNNKLFYNLWDNQQLEWKKAYNLLWYYFMVKSTIWLSGDDLKKIETENNNLINTVKDKIKNNEVINISWVKLLASGWVDQESINTNINWFDWENIWEIKKYQEWNLVKMVVTNDIKNEQDYLYQLIIVNIPQNKWEDVRKTLENKTVYTIEDVFVQDRESWINALDLDKNKILNWAYFKFASVGSNSVWQITVNIKFDDIWKDLFCNITKNNIWNQMAIFVWWKLKTAPVIRANICDWNAQIDWNFTPEEAKKLVDDLNDWAMPAPLILMQENKVSPILWTNALKWALFAWLLWILLIILLIAWMYDFKRAIVTFWVLLMFLLVLLAFMKLVWYALSLSWIAAMILSIWMWVDANILIYERMNEEKKSWKTILSSIETWYTRSLSPIRDWNVSTWLIAFLLFVMWINMFKWFWTMMIVNILLILFINVPLTRILLKYIYWVQDKD